MKVLHVISSFGAGGAESLVRDLSIALVERDIQVAVAAISKSAEQNSDSFYEQKMRGDLLSRGVSLYHLGHHSRTNLLLGIRRLRKILKEFKPDVLHIHLGRALLLRVFSNCDVPTVYTHHSTKVNFPTWLFGLFDLVTDRYVAISQTNQKILEQLTNRRTVVIRNAVCDKRFKNSSGTGEAESNTVLSVGSIVDAKDYDTLLRVAEIVRRNLTTRDPRVRFLVVGDGQRINEYREKVIASSLGDVVQFVGARSDVPALMKSAQILLMTSRYEGMPITLIEAMHAGLPVVCTDVGACREVIAEGFNGEVAPPGDAAELANKVMTLLENSQLRRTYSENARTIAEQFSIEKSATLHACLYAEVVKERRERNRSGRAHPNRTG